MRMREKTMYLGAALQRRDFITLLGAAAVSWPVTGRAEQPVKLATMGYMGPNTPCVDGDPLPAFVKRLSKLGWIEGRTVAIEYRWAEGRSEHLAEIAAEFVQRKVDVIVTAGTPPAAAAKQATSTIPIVFATVGDPVGTGIVASLARPGGNVTGLSLQQTESADKRLELLREDHPRSAAFGDHGQRRQSLGRVGYARGRGNCPHHRPGSSHVSNSSPRRYRALLSRRSKTAWKHSMSVTTRLQAPIGVLINTSALDARLTRCLAGGNTSK